MLTNLRIKNFKRFADVSVELGKAVVLIGPNNSGKTTALQAFALWEIGLRKWNEKRSGKATPEKRPGVTINRRDLLALPVPDANLLWRDLHVRDVRRIDGKTETKNIRVDIIVSGVSSAAEWECGMEFDYANDESFYCRPLRSDQGATANRMIIPPEASKIRFAFLPPMSGLAASEARLDPGAVNVRIGEGRTAEVLRNLCYRVYSEDGPLWESLSKQMTTLFGVILDDPIYVTERGEITMTYRERGISLDLSASGRGLQQTLLLLAHLYANPGTTLLLDEPDAHLEILRQRQMYHLLTDVAERQGCQIVAASHSEVILNEAADRDVVIAFVGTPHRIDDRGSQVLKALKEIGFEQYYQAEQTGFVLYLEGATDLAVLRAFAQTLDHEAASVLDRPFVHYVENKPQRARDHFCGLREAKSDLAGIALFDRLEQNLGGSPGLEELMWRRREIENYLVREEVLSAYAESTSEELSEGPLFGNSERERRNRTMLDSIEVVRNALATLGKPDAFSPDVKASDDFLDPLFADFYKRLGLPNLMRKTDYHRLARLVPRNEIDPEVIEKLDAIVAVSKQAVPNVGNEDQ